MWGGFTFEQSRSIPVISKANHLLAVAEYWAGIRKSDIDPFI